MWTWANLLLVMIVLFLACALPAPVQAAPDQPSFVLPAALLDQIISNRTRLVQVSLVAVALGMLILWKK